MTIRWSNGALRVGVGLAISTTLLLSVVAKLMAGAKPAYGLGAPAFYCVAAFEICLLVGAVFRQWLVVGAGAIVVALGGIVFDWLSQGRPCGCFGELFVRPWTIQMLRGFLGLAGTALIWTATWANGHPVRRGQGDEPMGPAARESDAQ